MHYQIYEVIDPVEVHRERNEKSEMSDSQLSFLFGIIYKYRPKKIVEVGVSAGGTSVEIIEFINRIGLSCQMYSVDFAERYYRDTSKSCGFLINEIESKDRIFHTLLTGKILPQRLDEIGNDIDFLILDTVHLLPGEILDFLAVFPFLKKGAIVVLHDTALHHVCGKRNIATNVLFNCVTADKILNNDDGFPNIAAFKINCDTQKYILDLFSALTLPWEYVPDKAQLESYDRIFSEYYGDEALLLWKQAKSAAINYFFREKEIIKSFDSSIWELNSKSVLIYGAGNNAKRIHDLLCKCGINAVCFVISNDQHAQHSYKGTPVYYFSDVPNKYSNSFVVMSFCCDEIQEMLVSSGYTPIILPEQIFEMLNLL